MDILIFFLLRGICGNGDIIVRLVSKKIGNWEFIYRFSIFEIIIEIMGYVL